MKFNWQSIYIYLCVFITCWWVFQRRQKQAEEVPFFKVKHKRARTHIHTHTHQPHPCLCVCYILCNNPISFSVIKRGRNSKSIPHTHTRTHTRTHTHTHRTPVWLPPLQSLSSRRVQIPSLKVIPDRSCTETRRREGTDGEMWRHLIWDEGRKRRKERRRDGTETSGEERRGGEGRAVPWFY